MKNQIIHGDCFEVMQGLPDNSVDAIITDPPYFTTNLDFDQKKFDWGMAWAHLNRVIKPNGVICVFSQIIPALEVIPPNRKNFRYQIVWEKPQKGGFLDANRRPLRGHELILVFTEKFNDSTYNPQKTKGIAERRATPRRRLAHHRTVYSVNEGEYIDDGTRYPHDVLKIKNGKGGQNCYHPTEKPVELINWLVKTYSNKGDLILDPFAGSGTTAIACLETGRNYICIEQSEEYVATLHKRVNDWHSEHGYRHTLEERVAWLETQVQAQGHKIKKLEGDRQLSIWDVME